jgi:hypothetical protein
LSLGFDVVPEIRGFSGWIGGDGVEEVRRVFV